jgi:hypothetical protein
MEMTDEKKKKKGFIAAIWESMTKTGGCCGSGQDCCGPSPQQKNIDSGKQEKATNPQSGRTS